MRLRPSVASRRLCETVRRREHHTEGGLVKTLGIDLAARPKKTAACMIEWRDGRATVQRLDAGHGDPVLCRLIAEADRVGIDAPFGWPDEFVEAVAGHHGLRPWPGVDHADADEFRAILSYRETDTHSRCGSKRIPTGGRSPDRGPDACHAGPGLASRLSSRTRASGPPCPRLRSRDRGWRRPPHAPGLLPPPRTGRDAR